MWHSDSEDEDEDEGDVVLAGQVVRGINERRLGQILSALSEPCYALALRADSDAASSPSDSDPDDPSLYRRTANKGEHRAYTTRGWSPVRSTPPPRRRGVDTRRNLSS